MKRDIIKILEERGFAEIDDGCSTFDDGESIIVYFKGDKWVELTYDENNKLSQLAVSNDRYKLSSDIYGGESVIAIGDGLTHGINIELFKYLLDLQENPLLLIEKACGAVLKFLEWKKTELDPVLEIFEMENVIFEESEDLFDGESDLSLPIWFGFQKINDSSKNFSIYFDPLTLEQDTTLKVANIYGMSSLFIQEALKEEGF